MATQIQVPITILCDSLKDLEGIIKAKQPLSTFPAFPRLFSMVLKFHKEKLKGFWLLECLMNHPTTDSLILVRVMEEFDGMDRSFPLSLDKTDILSQDVRQDEELGSMQKALEKMLESGGLGFGIIRKREEEIKDPVEKVTKNISYFSKAGQDKVEAYWFNEINKQLQEMQERLNAKSPFSLVNAVISL